MTCQVQHDVERIESVLANIALVTIAVLGTDAVYREFGFVESDGEQIYYESFGKGDVVVLSHGLGGNHAIWYQQVPVLAQSYRVVTWDQRGFGRSTNAQNQSSPKAAARDLAALLDHLAVEKAHLVGQSMGGWAVMGFALAHPERVESLVLADTIGGIYTPAIEASFDAYIREAGQSPPPNELPITQHPAIGEQLGAADPAKAFLYSQIGSTTAPAPANMGLLLRTTAYDRAALERLTIPTLFIVGEHDPIFPPATIREAAGVLPNAAVVELPNAGHSPYFETPAAWNDAVLEFLK
jgi:pimeloyl-ACP methyl ester carboxylesterase